MSKRNIFDESELAELNEIRPQETRSQMTSGFHSHYCPRCKEDKDCAQITHCRKLARALCADCVYDDYVKKTQPRETK